MDRKFRKGSDYRRGFWENRGRRGRFYVVFTTESPRCGHEEGWVVSGATGQYPTMSEWTGVSSATPRRRMDHGVSVGSHTQFPFCR